MSYSGGSREIRRLTAELLALRAELETAWHSKAVDGAIREAMLRAIAERDAANALLLEADEWLDASLGLVRGGGPPDWDGILEVRARIAKHLEPRS